MNKLMGPNGVITERERNKYLQNVQQPRAVDRSNIRDSDGGVNAGPNVKSSVVGLNNNNPFVYEGST